MIYEQNYGDIEKDMNNRNSTLTQEIITDNSKTRKNERNYLYPLLKVSKGKVEIVVQFH